MNVTALDVPLAVVIVTCADDRARSIGGTVTVHVFCAGQLVGATWPLNVATIWPLELRKLAPTTWTLCPALPLDGVSELMTGGPPGRRRAGVVVEVFVVEPEVPPGCDDPCLWPVPAPAPAWVGGGRRRRAGACVGPQAPVSETARAIAADHDECRHDDDRGDQPAVGPRRVVIALGRPGASGRRDRGWWRTGFGGRREGEVATVGKAAPGALAGPKDGALHRPERAPTWHALGRLVRLPIRHWTSARNSSRFRHRSLPGRAWSRVQLRTPLAGMASAFRATLNHMSPGRQIVVCEGDETGQELLEEALRVLDPDVLGFDLELVRFDLSLANRRATGNAVVHEAAAAMRETGLGLKAATITPEATGDVGSPNRILREGVGGSVIVRTGRRIPGVAPPASVVHPIVVVRMAVGDAYGAEEGRTGDPGSTGEQAWRTERIDRSVCRSVAEYSFRTAAAVRCVRLRRSEVDRLDRLRGRC